MGKLKKRQKAKNMAIYIVLVVFALVLTSGVVYMLKDVIVKEPDQVVVDNDIVRETKSGIQIETKIENTIKTIDVSAPDARKKGFYNFLVVGRDKAGLNTDVIMVVAFDTQNNKASIVQIPRDTYIEASPSSTNKKINAIFAHGYTDVRKKGGDVSECIEGGMSSLSDALLSSFGIVIDRYVHINTQGFRQIVDDIGGVEVTIQQRMYYNDPEQNLYIDLNPGTHLLNGQQAEGFVRFRAGYVNADLGRIDAQKIFMTAFMKKLLSSSTVVKLPKLISTASENTVTNITPSDMTSFGTAALKLDLGAISMFTMQGAPIYYNNVSYVSPYPKANLELVNGNFNVFNSPITLDDIKVRLLVNEPDGFTVEELTAADVSNDSVKLNFINKPATTNPPVVNEPAHEIPIDNSEAGATSSEEAEETPIAEVANGDVTTEESASAVETQPSEYVSPVEQPITESAE